MVAAAPPSVAAPAGSAEVRLVSVLFVDLVGFTSLSETRDAEDMRELLSSYFAVAREVVARHGGTVEKFIGDAVMAVWGAPLAHEDDALRAVRAAIELVREVAAFGARVGAPDLQARGGVATGRAASWASSSEGLVVGDRVNTAARVQGAAPPGQVLVDGLTHEATALAIDYRDGGVHQVKGKNDPLQLWQALRALDEAGRQDRSGRSGLTTYGRDGQMAQLIEVCDQVRSGSSAAMVLVSGSAGVGKSRLLDDFARHLQAVGDGVVWNDVRCTTYGSGVAYWALARIFRQRLGVADDESPVTTASKLEAALDRYLPDAADRDFVGPKLAVLLGLPGPEHTPSREEFFAGWRTFIAALARTGTVVLAIDNLQWADAGMLDFIDYLLGALADLPLLIVGLTRPELLQRREGWSAGKPPISQIELESLSSLDIGNLLDELVPAMPPASRRQVVERAEGIPLYAVEMVHMLTDRGLVVEQGGVPTLTQELSGLDTPVSLEALIAARLDELDSPERGLVKDLAVLGPTFTRGDVIAVSSLARAELDVLLASLQRKQVLGVSPEALDHGGGAFAFTQTLLRTIAYDRLGKRERRARHLAVASHMRSTSATGLDDVAESIAEHYRSAHLADPAAADAPEVRALAEEWLTRGALRAASVGAPERAAIHLLRASELATDESVALAHRESSAQMYFRAGQVTEALELFEAVAQAHARAGRELDAARLEGQIGSSLGRLGRAGQAIDRLRPAMAVLERGEAGPDLARVCSQLGRELSISGLGVEALPHVERAISLSEQLDLPEVLCDALETKALLLRSSGQELQALATFERTIEIASRRDLSSEEVLSGHANSADTRMANDLPDAVAHLEAALTIARRLGQRYSETFLSGNLMLAQIFLGDWQSAAAVAAPLLREERHGQEILHSRLVLLHALRREPTLAREALSRLGRWQAHDSREPRTLCAALEGTTLLAEDRPGEALTASLAALEVAIPSFGFRHEITRQAWPDACEAALRAGAKAELAELLDRLRGAPEGSSPPYLAAQLLRYRALARRPDDDPAETLFRAAVEAFSALGYPYWTARTVLDWAADARHGEPSPSSRKQASAGAELARLEVARD